MTGSLHFPEKIKALPYFLTLTHSWIYKPIGEHALLGQFGLLSTVSWSISTEWFLYCIFPLLYLPIAWIRSIRMRLLATGMLVVVALLVLTVINLNMMPILNYGKDVFGPVGATFHESLYFWLVYYSPYSRLFEFTLGCLTASIYMQVQDTAPSKAEQQRGLWLMIGSIVAILLFQWFVFGTNTKTKWYVAMQCLHMSFGFAPFLAILIFCCARYQNALVQFFSAPWMVRWGEASYSLYLWHFAIITAFEHTAAPVILPAVIQMIMALAAAIGFSLVSYSFIEVPARKWIRKVYLKKNPIMLPAPSTMAPQGAFRIPSNPKAKWVK